MDRRDEELMIKIRSERHIAAMMTLANLKNIKEGCEKCKRCTECKYHDEKHSYSIPCVWTGVEKEPCDWDIYDITERMYK